jgi:primosomal protein N' (replication factor Y)
MPTTRVINMPEEFREMKKPVTFSRELLRELQATLERREQAILFLNRLGFNTEVRCMTCGETLQCENCAVSLKFHRAKKIMRCHYCDYTAPAPTKCPKCESPTLRFSGTGTERAETVLGELLPAARLLRMDSDTMTGRDAHGKALQDFARGKYDILLGTQMVTKGFDFPNVTMVGVLAADSAIDLPDFRAAEKTFQLITQVIGRAGRADKAGVAVIQAFQPEHYAVQYALRQNFRDFAAHELSTRQPLSYPPFGRLARIVISAQALETARAAATAVADLLKKTAPRPGQVLGPAECFIERLHDRYRQHILIKSPTAAGLKIILAGAGEYLTLNKNDLQVSVDVDPLSLM